MINMSLVSTHTNTSLDKVEQASSMASPFSHPVAQRIWGSPDAIFLFFAGGAAEFAVIKAIDWLYFTNRLPSAPIERFFETVRFAQRVFFGNYSHAHATVDAINRIHRHVEKERGRAIPQWAYKDVLFIVNDYGERAHHIVFGPMSESEKVAYFEACLALGKAMHIEDLPTTYQEYQQQRHAHLISDYDYSAYTDQLFGSYRKALGPVRYFILRLIQGSLLPPQLRKLTGLKPNPVIDWLLRLYHYLPGGGNKLRLLHRILLPSRFAKQVRELADVSVLTSPEKGK